MMAAVDKTGTGTALLLVNVDCDEVTLEHCRQLQVDVVVAVDGGLRHCIVLGIQPDVLIGDLDSALDKDVGHLDASRTKVLRHNPDKDQTDLELALEHVQTSAIEHVVLAGLSGGRTDQMLGNWLLLGQSQPGQHQSQQNQSQQNQPGQKHLQQYRWRFTIDVIDSAGLGYLVTAEHHRRITVQSGATISLLALTPHVYGLTTDGLQYPLTAAELPLGSSLGISNRATGCEVSIKVTHGILLVYVNINDES